MPNTRTKHAKLTDLIPDNLNANKGTEFGNSLIEKSISRFGAGRSILLDKNNRIIAGNKTVENAGSIGIEDVLIIETDGRQLVAVKRVDVDLDSAEGRELAIADNASAKASISWDEENIQKISEQWDIEPESWGIPEFSQTEEEESEGISDISTKLTVECEEVIKLRELFIELQGRGFKCDLKE